MFSANHADNAGNVAIGYTALRTNIKGAQNVAIGDEAGRYATGSKNTFVGHRAGLGSTSAPYASGDENTAIGNDAFRLAETAQRNVAIGHRAGELIKTGNNNTYIGGYRTGYYNHAGDSNVGIGNSAIGADANTYVDLYLSRHTKPHRVHTHLYACTHMYVILSPSVCWKPHRVHGNVRPMPTYMNLYVCLCLYVGNRTAYMEMFTSTFNALKSVDSDLQV